MVTTGNEKQKAFDEAIARFHAIAAPDSAVAQLFLSAKRTIVKRIETAVDARYKPGDPIIPVSQSAEYKSIFNANGVHSSGPCMLCYIDDAVRMYERRKDAHAGETALLFDPDSKHIKAIRKLIGAYTESGQLAAGSKEFAAAKAVEKALNDVQAAYYLPKSKKSDGAKLTVYGYYSGEGDRVYGTGIVCRDYGKRQKVGNYQIIEIGADGLLPHLSESNAIASSMNHQVAERIDGYNDIGVIGSDGTVRKFHYNTVSYDNGNLNSMQNFWSTGIYKEPVVLKAEAIKAQKKASGADSGIMLSLSKSELSFVENEIVPYLEQHLPALASIPHRQRSR